MAHGWAGWGRTTIAGLGAALLLYGGAWSAVQAQGGSWVAVQAFVIEEWCVWCLVNDLVLVPLLATLTVWRLVRSR